MEFEGSLRVVKAAKPTRTPSEEEQAMAAAAILNGQATISNIYPFFREVLDNINPTFEFSDDLAYLRKTSRFAQVELAVRNTSTAPVNLGADTAHANASGNDESSNDYPAGIAKNLLAQNIMSGPERPTKKRKAVRIQESQTQNKKGSDGICSIAEISKRGRKLGVETLEVKREKVKSEKMTAN